jgi:hypothetical protein
MVAGRSSIWVEGIEKEYRKCRDGCTCKDSKIDRCNTLADIDEEVMFLQWVGMELRDYYRLIIRWLDLKIL